MPVLVIPVLLVALVAILAVLAYYGAEQLGHIIAQLIPGDIPIVGDRIRRAVDGFAQRAVGAVRAYVAIKVGPFADLIRLPIAALRVHLSTILDTLTSLGHTDAAIIRLILPGEINRVANALRADIARTDTYIKTSEQALSATFIAALAKTDAYIKSSEQALADAVRADIARTDSYIKASEAAIVAEFHGELSRATDYMLGRVGDVANALRADIARTDSALTAVETSLAGELSAAESMLSAEIRQSSAAAIRAAESSIAADITSPWGLSWPDITDALDGLEGVLVDDLPQIGAAIRAIPSSIPADIAGSIGITSGLAVALLRYLRDCGVPNCKNLGKVGHDLQALFGAVEGGSILSLVAAAARDPDGTAGLLVNGIGGTVTAAAEQTKAMVDAS